MKLKAFKSKTITQFMWTETQTTLQESAHSTQNKVLSTAEFLDWMHKQDWRTRGFDLLKVDFQPKEFFECMGQSNMFSLVRSGGGYLSFEQEEYLPADKAPQTPCFEWHTAGSHYSTPPHLVLLYGANPGKSENPTVLTDTSHALTLLKPFMDSLSKLDAAPIGKTLELSPNPLVRKHPWKESQVITLPQRSFISPRITTQGGVSVVPDLRTTMKAVQNLYYALDQSIALRHCWKEKDLLVFDNHQYLHATHKFNADEKSVLGRIWMNVLREPMATV